ncbi:MAG: protein kinase [Bacteroidaceae bacterium]|nr:protein kinase [Bacteroidaceae bacterium]
MDYDKSILASGTLLFHGKYKIVKYISSGGFGNTYEAIDLSFDEKVAIKELFIKGICNRVDNSNDICISIANNQTTFLAHLEKFKKEARRLRGINHDNIVSVRDLFEENETAYYVMDYIDGESLQSKLKRDRKPMSEDFITPILFQILNALKFVHSQGIWHLDIKTGNIMLDKSGNAYLIDFGASKQVKDSNGNTVTTTSSMAQTPGFAPPEQMEQNIERFGPWTDLYSLGATLFYCLSLKQPPMPSDITDNAENALSVGNSVSVKMHELIIWLMSPNRSKRPQTVDNVITWLNEYDTCAHSTQNNSYDTVIINKDKSKEKSSETNDTGGKAKMYYVFIVVFLLVLSIMGYVGYNNGMFKKSIDTEVADTAINDSVSDIPVNLTDFECSLGKYKYIPNEPENGYNSNNRPQGLGTAQFEDGRLYRGNFVDGNLEGDDSHFSFPNGDLFEGTFKNNMFLKGKYTVKEDGSYFEGTFKNGQPEKGMWHNSSE